MQFRFFLKQMENFCWLGPYRFDSTVTLDRAHKSLSGSAEVFGNSNADSNFVQSPVLSHDFFLCNPSGKPYNSWPDSTSCRKTMCNRNICNAFFSSRSFVTSNNFLNFCSTDSWHMQPLISEFWSSWCFACDCGFLVQSIIYALLTISSGLMFISIALDTALDIEVFSSIQICCVMA